MKKRGWDACDIILVTGDAYVDHPAYGAAIISRVLEAAGFRVGIIAQPDWTTPEPFAVLGRPRLFFAVTAGNLDSMVANYTANLKPRGSDEFSPGGAKGRRPDRSCIIYANRIREAFPGVGLVLGGLEASLRRLAHYDYWSDTVRRSIALDAKADILVYGMGESQIVEIARRAQAGEPLRSIDGVRGTVVVRNAAGDISGAVELPSYEETAADSAAFSRAFSAAYPEFDPLRGKTLIQKHGSRFVIHYPPAAPLSSDEMDRIYRLPYARAWHHSYNAEGGVPGFETVRFSVTSHRGCAGECSFCSLYAHQGRIVQSRSQDSILAEIAHIAASHGFKGTVTDIGGPTANLYGARCGNWAKTGGCRARKCLLPKKCGNLKLGYDVTIDLWRKALALPGVRHIFIGSGVRYDLLIEKDSDSYLRELCRSHVSGRLKVAPEHCCDKVLRLMNKPRFDVYELFTDRFRRANESLRKEQFLVNYFISAHPGSTLKDALDLALQLARRRIHPEQVQDFLPLPMTVSGAMYHTGADPFTGGHVHVPKGRERTLQRALLQYKDQNNKRYVIEALRKLNLMSALKRLYPPGSSRSRPPRGGRA